MIGFEEVENKSSEDIYTMLEHEYADDEFALEYITQRKNDPYYKTEEQKYQAALGIVANAWIIF